MRPDGAPALPPRLLEDISARLPSADGRALSWVRGCAIPVIWALGLLGSTSVSPAFHPFALAAAVWALLSNRIVVRARATARVGVVALVLGLDAVGIGILLELSGGLESRARHLVVVFPVALAFAFRPRYILLMATAIGAAYTAAALDAVIDAERGATRIIASFWVSMAWATAASMLLASSRMRRDARIDELATERVQLAAGLVEAQDRHRRALAEDLHDDALQHLLVAKQDLDEVVAGGDPTLQESAAQHLQEGITRLRRLIWEHHPVALRHQGLREGLGAICARHAPRGGFVVSLSVEPEACGQHDTMLLECARELVTNVSKHAGAANLEVTARADADTIELVIADDGRGIASGRAAQALSEGHIGLAACGERVRRHGGSLIIEAPPHGGTIARITVPRGPRA